MSALGGCSQPLINFVGASLDTHDSDSIMERRGYALLRLGADPGLPIDSPEKAFHGFDAFEFAAFLESRDQEVYGEVRRELGAW